MPNNKRIWEISFTVFSEKGRIHCKLQRAKNEKERFLGRAR